jgi:hypothetical protein
VGDLAALAFEIASELAGDIEHSQATLIVTQVKGIPRHPHIVASTVPRLVERYLLRPGNVGDVDHMKTAIGPPKPHDSASFGPARAGGEDFIADENVLSGAPGRVGSSNEAGPADGLHFPVERVQIVFVLGDELRVLGAAALYPVPDIEDYQPLIPVAEIRQPIFYIDVMEKVTGFVGSGLPARHLPGPVGITNVNDPE